ncbi:MAG: hypothetical protein K1X83_02495 [Oligoflexia bacterium]|nr:hypothetical protein [Oligoflexia bacterium]
MIVPPRDEHAEARLIGALEEIYNDWWEPALVVDRRSGVIGCVLVPKDIHVPKEYRAEDGSQPGFSISSILFAAFMRALTDEHLNPGSVPWNEVRDYFAPYLDAIARQFKSEEPEKQLSAARLLIALGTRFQFAAASICLFDSGVVSELRHDAAEFLKQHRRE